MYLIVKDLTFIFPSGKQLFTKLSLTLEEAGLYFLTGKNGAGKTTLARILAGLTVHAENVSGTITLSNTPHDLSLETTRHFLYNNVAYVNQRVDDMLAPHFTAQENLTASAFSRYPLLELAKHINDVPFGIPDDIPVKNLSGGQRQLLALAMVLQKKPLMLILDEPTSALDEAHALQVMDTIKQISSHILCICICHDNGLIERYGQKRILL